MEKKFDLLSENVKITKYMGIGGYCQGGTNFGKYYFQFENGNKNVRVVDLSKKEIIQVVPMPNPNSKYHCNAAAFGVDYYDKNDRFPLLYVSNENIACHDTIVYRITGDDGKMVLEAVQNIIFDTPNGENNRYYPNIAVDRKDRYLICLSLSLPNENSHWSELTSVTYDLYEIPSVYQMEVNLTYKNAVKSHTYEPILATQGSFTKYGKLFQASGIENNDSIYLKIFDIETGNIDYSVNIGKNTVIKTEPEAVFDYDNKMYLVDAYGTVFEFDGFL